MPNDLDVMASKAGVYQAQGNLREAAKFLTEINPQTLSEDTFRIKLTQLRLERNYGEAIRLLRARQAQFHFASNYEKAFDQAALGMIQRLAGDTAGAKVTAEQARDTLNALWRNQPENAYVVEVLSLANATLGEKEAALKLAESAIRLVPRAQDAMGGPGFEENLALIQTIFEENSHGLTYITFCYTRTIG